MTKLLPRRKVEEVTGRPTSTIYKMMRQGKFPRPVRIGDGDRASVMWREDEVLEYIEGLTEKRGQAYRTGPLQMPDAIKKRLLCEDQCTKIKPPCNQDKTTS